MLILIIFWFPRERSRNRLTLAIWTVLVAVKESLNGGTLQEERILFHLLGVVTLESIFFIRMLLVKIVSFLLRLERRIDLFLHETLPVVLPHPDVILYLLGAVQAKAIARLALQALIDEVSCLDAPAFGHLTSLDLHLLCEDHVANLFATSSHVRSLSKHELVSDNA